MENKNQKIIEYGQKINLYPKRVAFGANEVDALKKL